MACRRKGKNDYEELEEQTEASIVEVEDIDYHGLTWQDFNTNFYSSVPPLTPEEKRKCEANLDKVMDLRPFMIEKPFCVWDSYRFQTVLEIFRTMNLRHLPVVNEQDNTLVGIITRQDLFAFM